ncbi:MAG: PQQ-binding-like beta-propeller repeat protein [Pirellulaceae bacterium]
MFRAALFLFSICNFCYPTCGQEEQNPTPLFEAARAGDVGEVRRLLDAGIPVDAKSEYDATALMFACAKGHKDVIQLLLEEGADPNVKDSFYSAGPMAWAAMKQHVEVVMLLIDSGATDTGTALRVAVQAEKVDRTKALLGEFKYTKGVLLGVKKSLAGSTNMELKELFEDVDEPELKDTAPKVEKWEPASDYLDRYAGTYVKATESEEERESWKERVESSDFEDSETAVVTVQLKELYFSGSAGEATLKPVKQDEFEFAGGKFVFTAEGDSITSLKVESETSTSLFVRVRVTKSRKHSSEGALAEDLAVSSADWLQFRGNGARGVAEGQKPPIQWNVPEGENVLWKTEVEGLAHSCPIIVDDLLFLTTAISAEDQAGLRTGLYGDVDSVDDNSVHEFQVQCYSKLTGELQWKKTSCTSPPQVKRHLKSTHANPTPATDGKYVVAFFGSEGLYCYTVEGELVWEKDLGLLDSGWFFDASFQWGFAASPIIFEGMVIVQCDIQKESFIAAYAIESGEQVWRVERDEIPTWSSPTIVEAGGRTQLVTNGTNFARAYDPRTGEELWWIGKNSEIVVPTPFSARDLIFVCSGYRPVKPVYAIRPDATGDISLERDAGSSEHIAWSKNRIGPYMVSPVCYGDYLYTCNSSGILECLEATTGERVYRKRISGGNSTSFVASLLAADGYIYLPAEEGNMIVVRAGREFEKVAENSLGESMLATPAISEGVMYIRGAKHLIAVADVSPSSDED